MAHVNDLCFRDIYKGGVYGIMIYMFLPGSRPGAGWRQALSKTYRNLPFLPVVSWNPGKKNYVISPAPTRW